MSDEIFDLCGKFANSWKSLDSNEAFDTLSKIESVLNTSENFKSENVALLYILVSFFTEVSGLTHTTLKNIANFKPKDKSQSKDILKAWFQNHKAHPYPDSKEKMELSRKSGLSLEQINTWFINARRRLK